MTDIIAHIEEVSISAIVTEESVSATVQEVSVKATIADSMIINNAPFNPTQDEWDNFYLTISS